MTFITAAAAVETAKAKLATATHALALAADQESCFAAVGGRRPGHVQGFGTYTLTTDSVGAQHVQETLSA